MEDMEELFRSGQAYWDENDLLVVIVDEREDPEYPWQDLTEW